MHSNPIMSLPDDFTPLPELWRLVLTITSNSNITLTKIEQLVLPKLTSLMISKNLLMQRVRRTSAIVRNRS